MFLLVGFFPALFGVLGTVDPTSAKQTQARNPLHSPGAHFLTSYLLPALNHMWAGTDVDVTLALPFAGLDGRPEV